MAASTSSYRTHPAATTGMPPGIPFIVGNEAAERFSFYGMKTILVVFMTRYLHSSAGRPDFMTETESREWMHLFVASAYFFPVLGGLVADAFLGKYLTILLLSIVYCAGHLCLALMDLPAPFLEATLEPRGWLLAGLALVAIGSGGIKPCVSAHVGDQFGRSNRHLLERVFGWFYFSINFGSFFSTLLTPWLLEHHGPGWAFGVPGILMAIATLVFWLGRHRFVHVPPRGIAYFRETFSREGLMAIGKLVPLYLLVAVFWSLYDQTGGAWVQQAQRMDRRFLGIEWLESQIQAINPLLVLLFIPLFGMVVYPAVGRVVNFTPLRRILVGFVLATAAFAISAVAQGLIEGESARLTAAGLAPEAARWPSVGWQLAAYVVITAAEILVSITCLEFSYTQAPTQMKSLVMSLYLLSVSLGNLFTAAVNMATRDSAGHSTLTGASYYWFFAGCMAVATVLLIPVVLLYRPREYLQQEADGHAPFDDPQVTG
jgi:proton-dependent oligopeptide transporter, POT family